MIKWTRIYFYKKMKMFPPVSEVQYLPRIQGASHLIHLVVVFVVVASSFFQKPDAYNVLL